MPTVWGFVAVLWLGVVISDLDNVRRRYYGNAPIRPEFKRACGDKNATFREKIYYPVRKINERKNTYERKKLLFNF